MKNTIIIGIRIIILNNLLNSRIKIAPINCYSEVKLTIKGPKIKQRIINCDKTLQCDGSYHEVSTPDEININGIFQNITNDYTYDLDKEINNITFIWNYTIKDCHHMFSNLENIENIDFSKFDTSEVTYMGCMFKQSTFTSLDLSFFNTSKVLYTKDMFSGCNQLLSLNLVRFDISNVNHMHNMFYGCSSLVSLNLHSFDFSKITYMASMFEKINDNLIYCIKETWENFIISKDSIKLPKSAKLNCTEICNKSDYFYCLEDKCPQEYQFFIPKKKVCVKNCSLDDYYKYEYNNICYSFNFMELIYLDKVDKTDKLMNEELISNYLVYNLKNLSIYNNTEIYGKNINDTTIDKIMENVKSIISHIYPNEIIKEIKDGNDLMVFENNEIIINITSTENQKLNKNKNISTIIFGYAKIN